MRLFFSRFHPRYIRSLVYMLQASEYKAQDYLAWLHDVKDFRFVEKRKQIKWSAKTVLLVFVGLMLLISIASSGLWLIIATNLPFRHVLGAAIIILSPILLSYLILAPLTIIQLLVQKPIEFVIIYFAKKKLAEHHGVKIAIAGSYGKTSMREILKTVLSEDKEVAAPPHSYNTPLGISKFIKTLRGNEEVLIFELGEYYPGDVKRLCKLINPDIGIITGINEAHLQKFKTIEKTVQTIYELADFLGDKPLYVNGESILARDHARPNHIMYSREGVNSWRMENAHSDLSGTSFVMEKNNVPMEIRSSLLGLHQIGPLALSADLARRLGSTPSHIRAGTLKTKPFDHRLAPSVDRNGVTTLDDSYNGNPDGVKAVIAFLASLNGRRFYVTPGLVEMGSKKEEVHREIGRELARAQIEKVVLVKNSVTPFIEEGLYEEKYEGEVIWFDEALKSFAALPRITVKGDIVLLQNDWPDQYI
ncbi:MAG: UDP-N-acetylmuramoyl-tripeptide-D-alanyl-D-alanine ligase [Candidatus Uhrbacteria bacterium GW2011_GWF2_41_16]|uniref:UDP-N-acetylmuramoyl-tripeptide-D-alanyl-D-alanine ligase n=2 Tax=Candidatus Uhriibacteriota TaxID=1752732 RepID=A0A0G0XPP2_9BACT|nr:MAG: UDP-N-acetylmuramoyl-tripeptide-D-alanyl-D-alanine ligase [Candidatus Uhrbacteria bacterium GW2011_GWA2_41_10]KKR87841.1 MAG: UDP-N-acetylmuramoyl-tripeptide-D-alanyl-D-alanine ligase [Candidatus Uhrbacteria bacterium GW2011_GWC2_41_11]KKR98780.1 MAG: UDP-N-acetylmuramoyl-tripeptide-D-alanyl-D-alanine ligase [Candidatus Uhrbacteria bacterium GW2011_GWF2_41_16]HBP00377.1 hypothetical protein [Candidatus Uhrbacteria bacterium]